MRISIQAFLAVLCLAGCGSKPDPAPPPPTIGFDQVSIEQLQHGERVSGVLGCSGCHGAQLTGEDWSDPGFWQLWTANLTRAVPNYTDAQLIQVIREGRRPDRDLWGMPSHLFTQLSDDDMAALIVFLRSKPPTGPIHPAPSFEDGARQEIASGILTSSKDQVIKEGADWPPDVGADHALGRYIARATCAECHGMNLRGGVPYPGADPRPDLRMVGSYDAASFQGLMKTGVAAGGRELGLMSEVARGRYSQFTDTEIEALRRYLTAVAAQDAETPS